MEPEVNAVAVTVSPLCLRPTLNTSWSGTARDAGEVAEMPAPRASAAHRNHFHLDMAKRRNGNYCE